MIECTISWSDWMDTPPELTEMMVVAALRKAGIPALGFLVFRGVERGRVDWCDTWDGRRVFWEDAND